MRILFLILVIFVCIACGKESPNKSIGNNNLVLSTVDLIFLSEGEEKTFTISCNADWTISSDDAWCKVDPVCGTEDAVITVIVDQNESYNDRKTRLLVLMGDSVQFVTVTQKKKNALLLAKDNYEVPSAGEIIIVEVQSNVNYRVDIPSENKEWIKEIPRARALETKNLKFEIAANKTAEKRNGIIILKDKAAVLTGTVYVSQEQEYLVFSDDVFQQYLLDNFDKNNDGRFSVIEAASVDSITLSDGISLDNMYYFPNLKSLSYTRFQQEELDLTKNVLLEFVECFFNHFTSLNVSQCNLLTELYCYSNDRLGALDVSGCILLKKLICNDNQLPSLDVSNCTSLIGIACYNNQITTLNLLNNLELTILNCQGNQLTDLNLSKNTLLETLSCSQNQIKTLDLSHNILLNTLTCDENQLTDLNVSNCKNLVWLSCNGNKLTTLDVSDCTSLTRLWCQDNQLSDLDVSGCTSLKEICCSGNPNLKTIYKKKGQVIEIYKPEGTRIIEKK